jgi:hypothetical protein
MANEKTIIDALHSLTPSAEWAVRGDVLEWLDSKQTEPTESAIATEVIRLQAAYDAQAYARNRASAYASVGDQLDQIMKDMKNGTTTHQTACEAVKTQFPKE